MKDYGIDKGLIRVSDTSKRSQRGWSKGFFGFRKMFWDYLKKLNVAFYDECCSDSGETDVLPVSYSAIDDVLKVYDTSTKAWVDAPSSGATPSFKKYVGTIAAVTTGNATPTVFENTLTGTTSWSRPATGYYVLNSTVAEFITGKVWISGVPLDGSFKGGLLPFYATSGAIAGYVAITVEDGNNISFQFRNTALNGAVDMETILGSGASFCLPEIRLYP